MRVFQTFSNMSTFGRFMCLIVLCSMIFSVKIACASEPIPSSSVISLNDANFDELVTIGDWVINFYSPDCSHCIKLKPVWEQLATILTTEAANQPTARSVRVAKLDGTLNPSTVQNQDIQYYPSIRLYSDGRLVQSFDPNQPSSLEILMAWVQASVPPHRQYAFPRTKLPTSYVHSFQIRSHDHQSFIMDEHVLIESHLSDLINLLSQVLPKGKLLDTF